MTSQSTFKMSRYKLQLFIVICITLFEICQAFGNNRCRCVCPAPGMFNGTSTKRVYLADVSPKDCKCTNVVKPLPTRDIEYCAMCECKYDVRNTTTIKVVVIFIICVVTLLVVYMLFLLGLDPLMSRRNKYLEQMNEEDDQSVRRVRVSEIEQPPDRIRNRGFAGRSYQSQKSILNRVQDEQERWKDKVQEQRRSVYDRHTMLN